MPWHQTKRQSCLWDFDHWFHTHLSSDTIVIVDIPTESQKADGFTKPLVTSAFSAFGKDGAQALKNSTSSVFLLCTVFKLAERLNPSHRLTQTRHIHSPSLRFVERKKGCCHSPSKHNSARMNLVPVSLARLIKGPAVTNLALAVLLVVVMGATDVESLATSSPSSPSTTNLAGVLFDIDGTLVQSDPIHFAVFQELLLQQEGFNNNEPIDEGFFRKWISGRANALIMADFFPTWSMAQREAWSAHKEARFRQVAAASMKQSKMPGLDRLRGWIDAQALPKAAVTNAPRLNAEAILSGIGYDAWFDTLVIGDECEKPKPDPCPYLTACQRLGDHHGGGVVVAPDRCIVFEDSPSGARAGVAAGAFVVGILSGQEALALQEAGCHLIVQDFDDPALWKHLERTVRAVTHGDSVA